MRWQVFMLVGAFAAVAGACGSSPALRAARAGDFPSLQKDVAAEEKVGQLSNGEAATLASAVAAWEIASGPKDEQLARVREARGCARDLDGALASRMKTRDPAGAEAALARVEAGEMSAGDARDYAQDADDAWRAVGARGLVREDDDAARQKAYVDPAPAVRRAAMHAARIAKDPRDVETLAEAARVDPEPIVRTDAVRALAAIGGASVVPKLRDLWASADEPLREDIASAWGAAAVWGAGGRDELRVLLAQGRGPGAIEAAGAVLRGANRDGEIDASATALLARVIAKGSRRDRLHAIAVTPRPSGVLLDALHDASKDEEVTIRVAVLARLVESQADRDASIKALEAIAAEGGSSSDSPRRGLHLDDRGAAASRAKLALATAGDLRIQAWIEADLSAPEPATRLSAATALSALHRSARAAPLLADADPSVRMRAACTLLAGARR
jgi:hypothetical protein